MKNFKKKLAVILAVCMVMTNILPAYAEPVSELEGNENQYTEAVSEDEIASPSDAKHEDNILTEEEDVGKSVSEEEFEDKSVIDDPVQGEETPTDTEGWDEEFFGEVRVGNIIITARAEAGVVPKGTELRAEMVVDAEVEEAIDEAVEEKREDETQVLESIKLDIKLFYNGEEIEPNGPVSISFAFADALANAEANIYHIIEDEETKELIKAG